jgi:hypothetical protein
MLQQWVRRHIISTAMWLYIILYFLVVYTRPGFLYNRDGTLKTFGLGFRRKTVFPAWVLAISLAILTYVAVLFYAS